MYQLFAGGPWFDIQAVMTDDSLERLQQEVAKCLQRPEIKITKVYSRGEWKPNIRMASQLRSGRVFLAGGELNYNHELHQTNILTGLISHFS